MFGKWREYVGIGKASEVPPERLDQVVNNTSNPDRDYEKLGDDLKSAIETLKNGITANNGVWRSEDNQRLQQLSDQSGLPEDWLRSYINENN